MDFDYLLRLAGARSRKKAHCHRERGPGGVEGEWRHDIAERWQSVGQITKIHKSLSYKQLCFLFMA